MKKVNFFCIAALLCAFCLGCSEDDTNNNGGNGSDNGICKCSSATCDNCPIDEKTCNGKYITIVTGVSGLWNGKSVVHMSSNTETCPNGCVTISETEAECQAAK